MLILPVEMKFCPERHFFCQAHAVFATLPYEMRTPCLFLIKEAIQFMLLGNRYLI